VPYGSTQSSVERQESAEGAGARWVRLTRNRWLPRSARQASVHEARPMVLDIGGGVQVAVIAERHRHAASVRIGGDWSTRRSSTMCVATTAS
jgi:actin-like ATPase involved in cell morphogenesis